MGLIKNLTDTQCPIMCYIHNKQCGCSCGKGLPKSWHPKFTACGDIPKDMKGVHYHDYGIPDKWHQFTAHCYVCTNEIHRDDEMELAKLTRDFGVITCGDANCIMKVFLEG